jgi:hypothetical protein
MRAATCARRLGADYFIPEARSEVTFMCVSVCAAEVAFAGANDFFVTKPLFIVMLNCRNVRQGHSYSSPFFASVYDQNTLEGFAERTSRVVFASLERKSTGKRESPYLSWKIIFKQNSLIIVCKFTIARGRLYAVCL